MYSRFKHPNSVCMSYWKHAKFSLGLSKDFFGAGYKAIIHAIFPNSYIHSSTEVVKDVSKKLKKSGCNS